MKQAPGRDTHGGRALDVLNHELVGLVGGVDARLGADDGEREGVHDDESVAVELALHEPHDLVLSAGSCVHDLQKKYVSGSARAR